MINLLLPSLFLSTSTFAHGGVDFFDEIGEEISTGIGGGWARVFPHSSGEGWNFLWAAGGGYSLLPMTDDLVVEDFGRVELTGADYLVDHAITPCPSGGFLHVASANLEEFNDSAYSFRYDDDFGLLSSQPIEERVSTRKHNDLPVVCSPGFNGTAFGMPQAGDTHIIELDQNGAQISEHPVTGINTEGGTLLVEPETGDLLVFGMGHSGSDLKISRLNGDLNVTDTMLITLLDSNLRAYWPASVLRVGDHYIVSFMARDDSAGFGSDFGNVWLAVLNFELELEHVERLSNYEPPNGAMRPGLARKGSQLLVTVDREVEPRIFPIELNSVAFGFDLDGDTGGLWDTGTGSTGGTDDTGGDSDSDGCGCSTGSFDLNYLWMSLLPLVVIRRRA